jgi:hypothetical protein
MTDGEHIPQEDLALYAMQAFSAEESASVSSHLEECAQCRSELAQISGDLALVAMGVEQHSLPEGARQRFIDRIAATPLAAPRSAPALVVPVTRERPVRRFPVWVPWGAAAALFIISVWLGVRIISLERELQIEYGEVARLQVMATHAQDVLDVLTAPSAKRVVLTTGKSSAVPTGRAVYLAARGALIFEANNLARIPESKTYELWVIPASGSAPIPAGLFRPDATGSASIVLPPLPKDIPAKAFGVTIEKAEGADTPTAPIILSGAV